MPLSCILYSVLLYLFCSVGHYIDWLCYRRFFLFLSRSHFFYLSPSLSLSYSGIRLARWFVFIARHYLCDSLPFEIHQFKSATVFLRLNRVLWLLLLFLVTRIHWIRADTEIGHNCWECHISFNETIWSYETLEKLLEKQSLSGGKWQGSLESRFMKDIWKQRREKLTKKRKKQKPYR